MKKRSTIIIGAVSCACLIISVVSSVLKIDIVNRALENDFYFNILTLNSVIAGFSFTNIGLLLSTADTEVVQKLAKTDIMKKKNDKLISSVIYCVASMLISLPYVLDLGKVAGMLFPAGMLEIMANGFYLVIILLLVLGIVYFISSTIEISKLLDVVYKNQSDLTPEKVNSIHETLRGEKKSG